MNNIRPNTAETLRLTRQKRQSQDCKVFRFKIDKSSLSKKQLEYLKMVFLEAKYCYNYILASDDVIHFDYKNLVDITHLDKDRNEVPYHVSYLSAAMKQGLIEQMISQIKTLSKLKKKGYKVGGLKFKSEFTSINLKQYGMTHRITGNKIKLQGLSEPIRVNGLKQLSKYNDLDFANAHIIWNGYDYFISLTCYTAKQEPVEKELIGLDMGCRTTVTLSNGQKFNVQVGESERLKKLQAKLSRQVERSNNWNKTRSLIRKEYVHITNQKKDLANKILSYLNRYTVVMQDEQLAEWKKSENTTKIQHSALGRIKSVLEDRPDTIVLDKWLPTTKHCFQCGQDNQYITLRDKTFKCPTCGLVEDRDVHAAKNMILYYKDGLGTSRTSKPETRELSPGQENTMPLGSC